MAEICRSCQLEVRLFGRYEAAVAGQPLPRTRSRADRRLLAWLVLHADRDVDRDTVAGALWPDSAQDRALFYLRRTLMELRRALGAAAHHLQTPTRDTLRFDAAGAFADVLSFDAAVGRGGTESLERAVALRRGPLLEGFDDVWAVDARARREQCYVAALEKLADHATERGEHGAAAEWLRLAATADPFRESIHRSLMSALAECGDHAGAVKTYRDLRVLLLQELRTTPDAETTAHYHALLQDTRIRAPAHAAALPRRFAQTRRRLPTPSTSLIGRESAVLATGELLVSARLVTLTGAAGVGKTRLAIATAEDVADRFPDGAWFVDLSVAATSDAVPAVVAAALEARDVPGGPPWEAVGERLRHSDLLVVLDNCEHVLDGACEAVNRMLAASGGVRVLATSRGPLGLQGETAWPVPSLAVPDASMDAARTSSARGQAPCAAVQLFAERAERANAAFCLCAANIAAVSQIVRQVDGIPLAIELAAAQVRAMPASEIAKHLTSGFLLTMRAGGAVDRHQTMAAALEWSVQSLTDDESRLLRRLAIFFGSWTLDAAESVCGRRGLDRRRIAELLVSLVDRALVVYEDGEAGGRYRLLESVRQYADAMLESGGDVAAVSRRHFAYYLAFARHCQRGAVGPDSAQWLARIEHEVGNLLAALRRPRRHIGGKGTPLRMVSALSAYCAIRAHTSVWWPDCKRAVDSAPLSHPYRRHALLVVARLAQRKRDFATARAAALEACELAQRMCDARALCGALNALGAAAHESNDNASATRYFEEGLTLARETSDRWYEAALLGNLGNVAKDLGDLDGALAHYEASLGMNRTLGYPYATGIRLYCCGLILRLQGQYRASLSRYEEALRVQREIGDLDGTALTLLDTSESYWKLGEHDRAVALLQQSRDVAASIHNWNAVANAECQLGWFAYVNGDLRAALAHLRESLRLSSGVQDSRGPAGRIVHAGIFAAEVGESALAARLFGAADALFDSNGGLWRPDYPEYHRAVDAVRTALGARRFEAEWQAGRRMSQEEAVQQALDYCSSASGL